MVFRATKKARISWYLIFVRYQQIQARKFVNVFLKKNLFSGAFYSLKMEICLIMFGNVRVQVPLHCVILKMSSSVKI